MGRLFQFIGAGIICTLAINMGFIFAWPASTITLFESQNTTLNRPMTATELSLLGSLSSMGALISTLLAGFLLDKIGRKKCAMVISMSMILFWSTLTICRQVEVILTSIFLSGIASSVVLVASVYISEICQKSIRGAMVSANMVSYGIGLLLSYLLGGYLTYSTKLYVGLTQSTLSAALLFILKDSPSYLMQTGREKEAREAIAFFRHVKINDNEVTEELCMIKRALNPLDDDSTPEHEKLQKDSKPAEKLSFWQFMKKSKSTRRALFVNLVVITVAILQGFVVVQIYIEVLFKDALPFMPSTLGSVAMAAVAVISGIVAGYMTDILGRKPLIIYASIGAGISCVVLGTQMHCHWGPNWITATFLYVFPVMYTLGAGTVPIVLLADFFLPEVKSIVSMLILEWAWLCNFTTLFIFNPIVKAIGWGPVFYIFATFCFLTSAFCAVFLPETKGLTVNEVQPLFLKKRDRNNVF